MVLAGGAGRRLGGPAKPATPVGGRPMVCRVLDAVADAVARVAVGAPDLPVPPGVSLTRERPADGGPVAGLAAGLAALGDPLPDRVVVLAADLPLLTPAAVGRLLAALGDPRAPVEAAVLADDAGRPQWLCAAWRGDALARALAALGPPRGAAVRRLYADAAVARVDLPADAPPAWWDCDTPDALARARGWLGDPSAGPARSAGAQHPDQ
ncbi:molybdenum cofactor guanylyltransferase [Pilimelia terevasa]|uniref:molybdenum cofactor guanylyltransferase n=1 Tax=Pilimelia terevasa TaxID=53372 RepID=UPI00166DE66D|nr:NTP transferase domain-containing protein [Pilimelia terevasa]